MIDPKKIADELAMVEREIARNQPAIDAATKAPILATIRTLERAAQGTDFEKVEALARKLARELEKLPPELRSQVEIPVVELTPELGRELFDRRAREWLGISGEEFLRRWDAGEYRNADEECHEAIRLASMMPLAR